MLGEFEQHYRNIVCAILWLVLTLLMAPCALLRHIFQESPIKIIVEVKEI